MRHAKLLGDLAEVACCRMPVVHHACPTNYLQVGNFGQISKDLILDAISEKSILRIRTQIFKREDGDAFFRNWNGGVFCSDLRTNFRFPMKKDYTTERQCYG